MNQPDQFMAFVFTSKIIGLLPAIEGRHDCVHRGRRCSIHMDGKVHLVSFQKMSLKFLLLSGTNKKQE
jgi:hypothetical protein